MTKQRRILITAALVLVGAAFAVFQSTRNAHGTPTEKVTSDAEAQANPAADARQTPALPPVAQPTPSEVPPQGSSAPNHETPLEDRLAVIDEELASKLPSWLPLPENLTEIREEDVGRRSDGFFTGTLHLTLAPDDRDPVETLAARFMAGGLVRQPGTLKFRSADDSQRCEIRSEPDGTGTPRITIIYEGFSHDQACACPGCGHSPDDDKPESF